MRAGRDEYRGYPDGADLVIEVVSSDLESRRRDLEIKPKEYARAGIPEYWIVDPQSKHIQILTFEVDRYVLTGEYVAGSMTESRELDGFRVAVDQVFPSMEPFERLVLLISQSMNANSLEANRA